MLVIVYSYASFVDFWLFGHMLSGKILINENLIFKRSERIIFAFDKTKTDKFFMKLHSDERWLIFVKYSLIQN